MAVTTQTATFQTLCLKRNSQISSLEFRPQKERWRKCEKHSKFLCGEYHHSLTAVAPPRSNNIQVGSFQVRSCCTGDRRVAIRLMKMAQTEVKFKHFARRSVCWKCSVIFTAVGLRLGCLWSVFLHNCPQSAAWTAEYQITERVWVEETGHGANWDGWR